MPLTPGLVERMSRASIVQLSAVLLTLEWQGVEYVGTKADDRIERKYKPEGFEPGHRMTWLGCAADFKDGLPVGRPIVKVNDEPMRAVAVETDAAGGIVRIELSDVTEAAG